MQPVMSSATTDVPYICFQIEKGQHMATARDELKAILDQQPADSSAEELVRELALHIMIQRGLADSDTGRVYSN